MTAPRTLHSLRAVRGTHVQALEQKHQPDVSFADVHWYRALTKERNYDPKRLKQVQQEMEDMRDHGGTDGAGHHKALLKWLDGEE